MGEYPEDIRALQDSNTLYWKAIGKHRKLPLNNDGLIQSERGVFRSPDKFMVLILTMISALVIFSPVIYIAGSSDATYADGIYSAVIGFLFLFGIVVQFKDSRKRLGSQLKSGKRSSRTSQKCIDEVPPVS
jgi:hypothetical protein